MTNHTNDEYDETLNWSDDPLTMPSEEEKSEGVQNAENSDEDDSKKTAFAGLIKTFSMMILALAVLIFVSIAWFSLTSNLGTSGMSVKVTDFPFEIATQGTSGTRNLVEFMTVAPQYTSGTARNISGTTYYATGQDTGAIRLRYSTGDSEVGPGGHGVLELYVIPKRDGDLSLKITMDTVAFVYVDDNAGSGTGSGTSAAKTLVAIDDLDSVTPSLPSGTVSDLQQAGDYLNGHIMFFKHEGVTTNSGTDNNYYYTDPLIDREYEYTITNAEKGKAYHIPIYWVWPNTLGQIVLDGNQNLRSGIPLVRDGNTAEKAQMVQYLTDNKSIVFMNSAQIGSGTISSTLNKNDFDLLSLGYNKADYSIGTNVAYFLIDLTVEPVE